MFAILYQRDDDNTARVLVLVKAKTADAAWRRYISHQIDLGDDETDDYKVWDSSMEPLNCFIIQKIDVSQIL